MIELLDPDDLDAVRPAWLALASYLAEIDADLAAPRVEPELWERRRAQYRRWLTDHPAAGIFVAREDGKVAGYAMLRASPSWGWRTTPGPIGELETLSVLPDARGHGIGSALWEACAERLRSFGSTDAIVVVATRNAGARRFYEREGWVPFSSGWWLSPVPDWPSDGVKPVAIERVKPMHRALRDHHAAVEPPGLPAHREYEEVWRMHSTGMLREGKLLAAGEDGFVHVNVDQEGWASIDSGPIGHIEMLAVREEARGRGVGARLLHAGARAAGTRVVTLDVLAGNAGAECFYEREGFKRVSECLYRRL